MKRFLIALCIAVILFSLTSCQFAYYVAEDIEWGLDNTKTEIYNESKTEIGQIDINSFEAVLSDKIVYYKRPGGLAKYSSTFDYYCFDLKTQESEYLGTIENVYGSLAYQELCYNEHVYILKALGEPSKDEIYEYAVFDIDLENKEINKIHSTKEGHIYDTLSIVNGKLLISHLNGVESCSVVEYNIETGEERTVITSDCKTRNVIRTTCSDNEHVYVLRVLYSEDRTNNKLFLDTYDLDYKLLSSVDLKDIFDPEDQLEFDQTDQIVCNFLISNGYMLYDNRSTARFLGKIENGSVKSIIRDPSGLVDSAYNVYKDDRYFMLAKLGFNESADKLVLFDTESGSLRICEPDISEENYYLCSVHKTSDGLIMFNMLPDNEPELEGLPIKWYIFNESDLDFKDIDAQDLEAELQ